MNISQIHESLVNGQRLQAAEQIKEYGASEFFPEYSDYLLDFSPDSRFEYFVSVTVLYINYCEV